MATLCTASSATVAFAAFRQASSTWAPLAASASADRRPRPLFAPVTTMVMPVWSGMSSAVQGMAGIVGTAVRLASHRLGTLWPTLGAEPARPHRREALMPSDRHEEQQRFRDLRRTADPALRDRLVEDNLWIARHAARRFRDGGRTPMTSSRWPAWPW